MPFIQKAIAIASMTPASGKWGCSVVDAASHAAECSTKRVRKWAFACINTTPTNPAENPTDECLTDQLSSHGHHDYHAVTLLNNEDVQLAARSYV